MDGLFKVINVGNLYPSKNDEQLMLRDVVLQFASPMYHDGVLTEMGKINRELP